MEQKQKRSEPTIHFFPWLQKIKHKYEWRRACKSSIVVDQTSDILDDNANFTFYLPPAGTRESGSNAWCKRYLKSWLCICCKSTNISQSHESKEVRNVTSVELNSSDIWNIASKLELALSFFSEITCSKNYAKQIGLRHRIRSRRDIARECERVENILMYHMSFCYHQRHFK